MIPGPLATSAVWVLVALAGCISTTQPDLCHDLRELRLVPFKDEAVDDPVYNRLKVAGWDAVPCLLDRITDTTLIPDPRKAPPYGGFTIGDAAVVMLSEITGEWESVLPPEVLAKTDAQGVYAYFEFVETPEGRRAIQQAWRKKVEEIAKRQPSIVGRSLTADGDYVLPTPDGGGAPPSPPSVVGVLKVTSAQQVTVLISGTAAAIDVVVTDQTEMFTVYGGAVSIEQLTIGDPIEIWYTPRTRTDHLVPPVAAVVRTEARHAMETVDEGRRANLGDTFDWNTQGPVEFLALLKTRTRSGYTIFEKHAHWVREEHLPALFDLLDSNEPCGSVRLLISSVIGGRSTVGHEAAVMIIGYQRGVYPPGLTSTRLEVDKERLRQWWKEFSNPSRRS